ncbi:hypothetical protein SPAR_31431 [Streptomyces sparsogenes DSM 40356]|uniref:Uncharacterized protein n=1 Tax=Streptomyces sparsogenes DSM 40356 TaxID=1331668 RepID=A0A1R1SB54_9ACTN|nr:hypothetical protein SPAR_31431 [Streptomyces sparsogenes DSM 40356]
MAGRARRGAGAKTNITGGKARPPQGPPYESGQVTAGGVAAAGRGHPDRGAQPRQHARARGTAAGRVQAHRPLS